MSEKFRDDLDLIISLIFSYLGITLAIIPPLNNIILRIVITLPIVLFIPGYSLIGALFPRKNDLNGIERIALSFVLSLSIVPLLGLILNFTPFGIRYKPVLVVLSTFTISSSIIAWNKRLKLSDEERFRVPFEKLKINLGKSILDKGLSIVLIASIIGSFATLAYVAVTPKTGEKFTEFYILDPNGTTSNYPTVLKVGEAGNMIIAIVNHEYENVTYRLEVNFNGTSIYEENVFVIENEKWESPFTFKAIQKGENQKLEFLIYKDKPIEAYRKIHLWINVT